MARTIAKGGLVTAKLARLYMSCSNRAPVHYALCPTTGCATALAMLVAFGCCGVGRLVAR